MVRRYALPNGLAVVGVAPVEGASGMEIDLLTGGKNMLNFENLLQDCSLAEPWLRGIEGIEGWGHQSLGDSSNRHSLPHSSRG